MSRTTKTPNIVIRDIESISEMRDVESLEKEVWECDDREIVPVTVLVAVREVGGILIGAYNGLSLVGFAFGFIGREDGELVHHSHMLAVRPSHRSFNLGYLLKLAQRERALERGIKRMTWTFDPLQSLNAYFNFGKLGVLSNTYKVDFYGESTSSPLHQTGTDRLWVTWLLDSSRVRKRMEDNTHREAEDRDRTTLIRFTNTSGPERAEPVGEISRTAEIEIPEDIGLIWAQDHNLARRWREESRDAFQEAIASGFVVTDFVRRNANGRAVGVYFLKRGRLEDFSRS